MSRAPRPTIQERAAQRVCQNCGGEVPAKVPGSKGPRRTFCTEACKREHGNRHIVEGRAVIALLKAWRIDRGQGETAQAAFAQVCTIVDSFNAADAAYRGSNGERRPRADLYAAKILATGTIFADRQHAANKRKSERRAEAAATAI